MNCNKKPGRPAGDKRQALSQWVSTHGHFTMGQVARGLGWSICDADNVLRRALARRELEIIDKVLQPGCKRKVALYARADLLGAQTLNAAMNGWAR
ncbi:MAG: hypothetical protein ACOYB1_09845 [Limnohabitans sp.]